MELMMAEALASDATQDLSYRLLYINPPINPTKKLATRVTNVAAMQVTRRIKSECFRSACHVQSANSAEAAAGEPGEADLQRIILQIPRTLLSQ